VFHRATLCDAESRAAFLEQACGTDSELRREVESLLASLEESAPFLEAAVQSAAKSYFDQPAAGPVPEGSMLDRYRIVRMLGAGGMGEVYLAEDTRLHRNVALKMLPPHLTRDPLALRRLEFEARVLSSLNHANLLTIFEFCPYEGRHFLVTEFVEGETVRSMVRRGRLPSHKAIDIAAQTAEALGVAHASGIIHRDIKPANLIVRPEGCVKVVDFGIAKLTEASPQSVEAEPATTPKTNTISAANLGTPRYMSPEQARGVPVDGRSDIFSLAAVLYEMLSGKAPFSGNTHSDLIADILRGEPLPLTHCVPGTSKKLQAIVWRALAKDREQRYETAAAFVSDLKGFQKEEEFQRRPWKYAMMAGLATLLLTIALASLFLARRTIFQSGAGSHRRTLAVLPFRNLRPDPNTDFLGVSLADEVTAKLGYVKALTVRQPSATIAYREGGFDLHKAAAKLNAEMLLTGSYLKDGNDLRITARLIGFNPETLLWQNTLNVKYDKLLTVQDQVSQMIIDGLALRLGSDEQRRLKSDSPVDNLAYEYYLRGVDLYATSNFTGAIMMLEKSVAINPNYAPTWAYLGRAYTTEGSLQFGGRKHYQRAEEAYEKAIALNPVFPEPRVYMANLFTDTGRVEEAVPLLRVALQSSPNNAEAHWELGYAYRYGGMLNASVSECELARRLDPEVKINSSALNTYLYLFEYDKFLNSLPVNDSPLVIFYHGLGSYYKHLYDEASNDFDRAYDLAPDLLPAQIGKALSEGLHHSGAEGLARLRQLERKMNDRGVRDPEAMYKVAQAYAILGDSDSAVRMLDRSTSGGFFCYDYIARDLLLNSLHALPKYARVLEQVKQRAQQFEKRFDHSS
jgi:TolB-like protein